MATRRISTVMAIQGENEYRSAMTRINGEIKALQSSLKLTESQYRNNANSMEALTSKGKALSDLYAAQEKKVTQLQAALDNARAAEKKYTDQKADLSAQIEKNNRRLKELQDTTGDTSEEQAKLTKENEDLTAQLGRCDAGLEAAEKGVSSWQTQLNNAKVKLNDLGAEVQLNNEYMEEAAKSSDGCATSVDRFGNRIEKSARQADDLRDALMAAGVVAALKATADALIACAKASIEYESAMAGVAKTTDMSADELGEMGEAMKDLSTKIPGTATEIAAVAESAGQLGIAKEDLLDFSSVMINLGVSTNLSSEEAASALAKFANVVGMSADKYENLGSVIVDLGNHFATTEADIVSMATRLASTGSVVGLSESQIMAVATALSAVGIEAEAGGSAISKLLKQFETMVVTGSDDLDAFADVAGMSADEFRKKWGEDAVGALDLFLNGLGEVDASGGSAVAVLDDLGLTEVRLSNAVLALAGSHGVLGDALHTAEEAWSANTALAKEAETRYATTESKMQMLANSATNVKIAVGDKLTPAIGNLADVGISLTSWLADVIEKSGPVVPLITATATALGVLSGAIVAYTAVTKVAAGAAKLFHAVMDANPIYLTVAAVASLAAGLGVLVASLNRTSPELAEMSAEATALNDSMAGAQETFDETEKSTLAAADVAEKYIKRLEELEATGLHTTAQQREYHEILGLLCDVVPELSGSIDLETDSIDGGTAALRENTEAWRDNALQQAYQEKLTAIHEKYADVLIEQAENEIKLAEAKDTQRDAAARCAEIEEELNSLYEQQSGNLGDYTDGLGDASEAGGELHGRIFELRAELENYRKVNRDATTDAEDYAAALDADKESVSDAEAEISLAEEAIRKLTKGMEGSTESMEDAGVTAAEYTEVVSGISSELDTLAEAYAESYDAALESITGQIGLFDDFSAELSEDTDTVEEMMARWSEQTENLGKYTENLRLAAEYGLDEGLIASLSDGSAESAEYLAVIIGKIEDLGGSTEGLSGNAEDFVKKFNKSFAGTKKAKESFAHTVAGIETDLDKALKSMEKKAASVNFDGFQKAVTKSFGKVGHKFEDIGSMAGAGLSKGIKDSSDDVSRAAKKMAKDTENAAKEALDIHSPSGVFDRIGRDADKGAAQGIERNTKVVTGAAKRMSTALTREMESGAKKAVKKFDSEFSEISSKTKRRLDKLVDTVTGKTDGLPSTMYSVGQEMTNGMIRGLNSRSSSLYWTIENIVSTAIARASAAAEVASPSKKTTRMFEFVGDGMVKGLENRREKVKETSRRVVEDALNLEVKIPRIDDRMPPWTESITNEDHRSDEAVNALASSVDKLSKKVDAFANGAWILDGDTVVGKHIPRIDKDLGSRSALRRRGVV